VVAEGRVGGWCYVYLVAWAIQILRDAPTSDGFGYCLYQPSMLRKSNGGGIGGWIGREVPSVVHDSLLEERDSVTPMGHQSLGGSTIGRCSSR